MVGNSIQPNGPAIINSKVYLLDIRNFTWVNTFEPSTPSNPSNQTSTNPLPTYYQPSITTNNSNGLTMKIVTATLSAILCSMFIMTIGFFGFRWYKNRQREGQDGILRVHGNHGNIR